MSKARETLRAQAFDVARAKAVKSTPLTKGDNSVASYTLTVELGSLRQCTHAMILKSLLAARTANTSIVLCCSLCILLREWSTLDGYNVPNQTTGLAYYTWQSKEDGPSFHTTHNVIQDNVKCRMLLVTSGRSKLLDSLSWVRISLLRRA